MKTNQFAVRLPLILLVLALQGCGQKKDASSFEKISSDATTNQVLSHFEQLKADAERGIPKAQYELGVCYYKGDGVENDYVEAVKWFRKAAEQNYAAAQFHLGACYSLGRGVAEDHIEAVKWYRKAADQNCADAQRNLGYCYSTGKGVVKNDAEAAKWYSTAAELYRKAAEQGDTTAAMKLGSMYFDGKGVPQNNAEAIKWLRKAGEQGDAKTQFEVGFTFQSGSDVPKDEAEAWKWFLKAAERGNAAAQGMVGALYDEGKSVTQDYAKAVKWFHKAAEQGDALAEDALGNAYKEGKGVSKDYAEAIKWYLKAAEQGDQVAQIDLGNCYEGGEGVPKNYVEAYKWYNIAASNGGENERTIAKIYRVKERIDFLETVMTPDQIAQAQELSSEFKPRNELGSNNSMSAENPTASGSGFFITNDGYLISNYHVVKEATKVRLVTSAGTVDAKVVQVDAANDLALLKADGRFAPLPILPSRSAHLGGTVATIGFPDPSLQGFSPKLAKGEIASLSGAGDDPRYFQISVPVQPGNSGGALVDERGNVIGIVSAKLDASVALAASGALPENVNYAVKSSLLLSFLESVPDVSSKLKAPNTVDEKFEDVVKSAQDAAVLVLVY